MALRLTPCSPRCSGLFSHRRKWIILHLLSTSIGVPGPHGLTVRDCAARLAARPRPSHPTLDVRDDRDAASCTSSSYRTCRAGNEVIGGLLVQGNRALRRSPALPKELNEHFETTSRPFPFFAAAIFVVTVTNTHRWLTVWGAHFYFWGRIVYAILYTADLPLARSLVWNIPTIGILMNVAGLFLK